jgi:hypothetical protein
LQDQCAKLATAGAINSFAIDHLFV